MGPIGVTLTPVNDKRWPHGYKTGFCCDGNHHMCHSATVVCHCACHRAQHNGQAPRQAP